MKYRGQKDAYKAVVDAIAVGPEVVRSAEAEDILGLSTAIIHKARARLGIPEDELTDPQTSGLEFDPYEDKRGRPSLRELFVRYAGGQRISLNQSDKWLKQSDVIDNWNVTTTDTAIAFRKISRFEIQFPILTLSRFFCSVGIRYPKFGYTQGDPYSRPSSFLSS
jgi:hypothetical protein